jgi:hypothetical protein
MSVAARARNVFQGDTCLRVAVENGDRVTSLGRCANHTIDMADEPFVLTCYGLALGSFVMVLGVEWLESLGSHPGIHTQWPMRALVGYIYISSTDHLSLCFHQRHGGFAAAV